MPINSQSLSEEEAQSLMSQLMDGELSPTDAERLDAYLQKCPEAIQWMESLDLLRSAAAKQVGDSQANSVAISSIQKAIANERENPTSAGGKLIAFPKWLAPIAAAAAIAFAAALAWLNTNPSDSPAIAANTPRTPPVVEFVETGIPDASTFVYTDEESGWTIVWVEPIEPEHG